MECALALPDILDAELQSAVGLSFRWYDVLVNSYADTVLTPEPVARAMSRSRAVLLDGG